VSAPPEMMERLKQGQGGGAPMPGGGAPGPGGTPMATPQAKEGKQEKARLRVHIAMNMLEQALPDFGAESEDGTAILKVLLSLSKTFGDRDASDLVPAEIKQMNADMTQMGGGSEMQQQIAKMQATNGPAKIPQAPAPMPMPQ
jgi:hypothetical protein